jgi:hypothetical protein
MSTPYGTPVPGGPGAPGHGSPGLPSTPPPKNRTPLYIALACGCIALLVLVIGGGGVGVWMIGRDGGEGPTRDPSTTGPADPSEDPTDTDPSEDPSEDPTTGIQTDQPIDKPTEGPSSDATSPAGESLSITVSAPEEGPTLKKDDETTESENGKYVGVAVTLWNKGTEDIGLSGANFTFYDADGRSYPIVYGSFSTSGPQIEPDEEATALLYADVPEDMELTEISYTDEVGTGGTEVRLPVG